MTRTFDADQSPLWVRSELARIDLIRLTTYSDRAASTVDTRFYFARQPVLFDWDNEGTDREFWPMLKEIGPYTNSINHLSSPNDVILQEKPLEIVLSNEPYGASAERLINTLRDGHTLENATLEWTQIALAERPTTVRIDLSSLVGDEHTFWYRGRVNSVGPVTHESITLKCTTDIPTVGWLKALDATKNDPADYGRRLPIVYGEAKRVRAVAYEVGWVTTLAEDITSGTTGNVKFTDLSGISGAGNLIRIDGEEVLVTYVDDTTGNITNRAQSSTTAAAHEVGAPVVEMITTSTYVVAGHPVSAIQSIYMRSPIDGSLIRLDSGEFGFTTNTEDVSTISGEVVASVSFTQAQFRAVLEYLAASGGVTQQPDFDVDAGEYVFVPASAFQAWTSAHTYCGSLLDVEGGRVFGSTDIGDTYGVEWYWPTGSVADTSREVVRWRIKAVASGRAGTSSGNYDTLLDIEPDNIPGLTSHATKTFTEYANVEYFATAVTAWATATGGTVLGDLESAGGSGNPRLLMDCYQTGSGSTWNANNFAWCLHNEIGLEVELVPQTLTRTDDVEIDALAAAMGNGVELWADVDGFVAPDATPAYKAGASNLMTKPCDIMRHWIEGRLSAISIIESDTWAFVDSDADATSYLTYLIGEVGYLDPTANSTILAAVVSRTTGSIDPDAPTLSGCNVTWTLIDSVVFNGGGVERSRLSLFRGTSASPSQGRVTVDFGSQTQMGCVAKFWEFLNTDITTDDGIVQDAKANGVGSSQLVTLAAFSANKNATSGAFGIASSNSITVGSGFSAVSGTTEIKNATDAVQGEWKDENDTSVDTSTAGSETWGGIAVEVAAASQYGGIALATIDSTSYDDCNTNLGSAAWAFDARTLGDTYLGILAQMAFEARATLVLEESATGTVCKMLTANSSYQFPAASGAITEWERGGFVEADQDVRYIHASRFTFPYAPDWSRGSGEEAFTQLVIANEDTNDLTLPSTADFATAADKIGAYEAEPLAFKCIQIEATAEEIAGYYCHERIRMPARLLAISEVPWWEAYALEVGDIIEATPPWDSSAVKCRVLEYIKDPRTEQIELRLVEVE